MQRRNSEVLYLWKQIELKSHIKTVALIAFGGYVIWNAVWLICGHIPPSIFKYCTGLPCPTTGMTRSLISLSQGDLEHFLLFNPLTSVYLVLMGVSAVILVKRRIQKESFVLPNILAWSWLFALTLGWLLKFVIGNKYW